MNEVILIFCVILTFLFFWFYQEQKDANFKLLFVMLGFMMMTVSFGIARFFIEDMNLTSLTGLFDVIFAVFVSFNTIFIFYVVLMLIKNLLHKKKVEFENKQQGIYE